MRGLQGKSAIVTGAGSGIGRAIALRLGANPRHSYGYGCGCAPSLPNESIDFICKLIGETKY